MPKSALSSDGTMEMQGVTCADGSSVVLDMSDGTARVDPQEGDYIGIDLVALLRWVLREMPELIREAAEG